MYKSVNMCERGQSSFKRIQLYLLSIATHHQFGRPDWIIHQEVKKKLLIRTFSFHMIDSIPES